LGDLAGAEFGVALGTSESGAGFFALGGLGAFAELVESLAPPGLGGSDALGAVGVALGLGGFSVLGASLPFCGFFAPESGSIS
jgi:hypothetical protein